MTGAPLALRRTCGLAATALFCAAAYWSARLACADRLASGESPAEAARAIRLAPANARYWLRWADLVEQAGEHSGDAIDRAVAADPYDASVWIRAGLRAETNRDYTRAERCLLEASRLSRQYEPRWTLANYYFRRGNAEAFWRWLRSAAEWAYGDRRPLFDLAWAMSDDAELIERRAIPQNAASLSAYLEFLLAGNRLDAAEAAGVKLARLAGGANLPILLREATLMIDARRPARALAVWNVVCERRLLPYPPLKPARGTLLTNGDFAQPPLDAGFDWRMPPNAGVSVRRGGSPPFLRFSLSGKQPEQCSILAQLAPATPATAYTLRFEYQTSEVAADTGLRWRIYDAVTGADLAPRSPHLSSGQWKEERVSFATHAATRWVRLTVAYQRTPGTTRIEGALSLRRVTLEAAR